jgi:hypothetical protein
MSDSVPEEMIEITNGRANAVRTLAEALRPKVFVKRSIPRPRKKEDSSNNQRGVSNGNKRMKKT